MHFGGVSKKCPLRPYPSSANCHLQLLYLTLKKLLLDVKLIWELRLSGHFSLLRGNRVGASPETAHSLLPSTSKPPRAPPQPRVSLCGSLKLMLYSVGTIFPRDKLRRWWTGCSEFLNFLRWVPAFPASISAHPMWGS